MTSKELHLIASKMGLVTRIVDGEVLLVNTDPTLIPARFDPLNNPSQLLLVMKTLRVGPTPPCYGSDQWGAETFIPKDENNLSHRCHYYCEGDTLEEAVLASALMYAELDERRLWKH